MIKSKEDIEALDKKLTAKGMRTLTDMLETPALGKFALNVDVDNLDLFEEWLISRRLEMMGMKMEMIVNDNDNDEMFEWILSHASVFDEILNQFRACRKKSIA